jgi:NADPH:quinone reductase-like Zn-dependent oxidoreductase
VSLAGEGKLKAKIEKVFPLSDAPAAHRMMEGDVLSGKIVLDPTAG